MGSNSKIKIEWGLDQKEDLVSVFPLHFRASVHTNMLDLFILDIQEGTEKLSCEISFSCVKSIEQLMFYLLFLWGLHIEYGHIMCHCFCLHVIVSAFRL